jgi:hypothetical protein
LRVFCSWRSRGAWKRLPAHPPHHTCGEVEIATIQEFEKPWSAKKFTFRKPFTREKVQAIVVRLPNGPPERETSYWAFALEAPFEHRELEYLSDLGKLASQYGFRASHPMVGNPCSSTVYDPLRLGTIRNGAWARGEAVQGMALRPPLAIDIRMGPGLRVTPSS